LAVDGLPEDECIVVVMPVEEPAGFRLGSI
jgi:hypothetical protein